MQFGLGSRIVMTLLAGLTTASAAAAAPDPRLAVHALGDVKAPVRIDEFASLACPHCAEFSNDVLPKLKAEYIDSGKVQLVFHDFPIWLIGAKAAELTRCVPADHYFPMIETLYRMQPAWTHQETQEAQIEALKQQAKFAGLTDAQINQCLSDQTLEEGVLQEQVQAQQAPTSVKGTPTFILNGNPRDPLVSPTYEQIKARIDALLRR